MLKKQVAVFVDGRGNIKKVGIGLSSMLGIYALGQTKGKGFTLLADADGTITAKFQADGTGIANRVEPPQGTLNIARLIAMGWLTEEDYKKMVEFNESVKEPQAVGA